MPNPRTASVAIAAARARALWLEAQRLSIPAPFGAGPEAVRQATAHLGYVQIDTIHVIGRSHHHVLYSRIPAYRKQDLEQAQAQDKSVFEYWTHALAYVPIADYRMYVAQMARYRAQADAAGKIDPADYARLLRRIRSDGPLSIRDIDDDVLVEKTHPWGSRKPSRAALRYGFFSGDLVVSQRSGMLKTYELAARHFGWSRRPRPASDAQYARYLLQRALRAQGLVGVDSICYGNAGAKPAVRALLAAAVAAKRLVPVHLQGQEQAALWAEPALLEHAPPLPDEAIAQLLSPFDPLLIQRKRLQQFFGYEHRFEAYVPAPQRVLGYFALPVLVGDRIVAALDLKMERQAGRLLIQKWTWLVPQRPALKAAIDAALQRFERFHLQ
ncbi:winged helix DNA-binding domain-containing protein [Xanthomonas campestris pv. phormiicola]|nr:winged helix DNA-binding domain-containing protein [Xanthomonas campestris pv. phormiicola]UYC17886.1 winged helix DNA-binding domain-containing protein [Xanthomonas campestris pv. phormiicola]